MTFIDYFLGQPTEYDHNNQVVKRDFGIQNLLLIVFTAYVLYNLFWKNKNQRGGGPFEEAGWRPGERRMRWRSWFMDPETKVARGWVIFIVIVPVFVVMVWLAEKVGDRLDQRADRRWREYRSAR